MDELEERARLFGDSVKQSYNAKCLERKWLRFLLVHGDEIGFNAVRTAARAGVGFEAAELKREVISRGAPE